MVTSYAAKTWLITKEEFHSTAVAAFADADVKITIESRSYLRTPIGTIDYIQSFLNNKVLELVDELELLAFHTRPGFYMELALLQTSVNYSSHLRPLLDHNLYLLSLIDHLPMTA